MARTPPAPPSPRDFFAHIELLALATLRPHPRNDGHHPPDEIAHLRASIREHDIYRNVVVAQDGTLLAGHGVILAAAAEGKTHVPGYRMSYDPDDPRALKLLVGDNHQARLREQDDVVLAALLEDIAVHGAQELLGTGFDEAKMALLLASIQPAPAPAAPDEFASYDENIATQYCCPKCGYEWSGRANAF